MSVIAFRRPVAFAVVIFVTILAGAKSSDNSYPNELKGFEIYAKYLATLRPGISSENAVRNVFGDTEAVQRNGWTINTSYAAKSGPVSHPALGPLAEIIIRPDGVVPMGAIEFPPSFAHCHSSVSEINISFDVYSDSFGLEYWLHEKDSKWGRKGDLYQIVYGPRKRQFSLKNIC
jgi:hypothetical protein